MDSGLLQNRSTSADAKRIRMQNILVSNRELILLIID